MTQENQEDEVQEITIGKKLKAKPKDILYLFSILFMIALIGLMTLADIYLDPNHFDVYGWITKSLILIGIQIPSIIIGELLSEDRQMGLPGGMYQNALKRFKDSLKSIEPDKLYFSQFFFWFKQKEIFNKKVSYLLSHDFDGLTAVRCVKYIELGDLDALSKHTVVKDNERTGFKEVRICQVEPCKIQYIRNVLDGKLEIMDNSYSYYLFANSTKKKVTSILEEGSEIQAERVRARNSNRVLKIVSFVTFSFVFSMFVIDNSKGADQVETWINLITRLTSMVSGLCSGWLTSVADVKLASNELDVKSTVLETFRLSLDKHEFVPKSYEELAKEGMEKEKEAEDKDATNAQPEAEEADGKIKENRETLVFSGESN